MEYYIAQFFGILALIALFMSYQNKEKKKFLIVQIFANIFYALQYIFLKAYSGFGSSAISTVKTIAFYNYEKKESKIPLIVLISFEIAFVIAGIITFEGLYSLIPIVIHCVYTLGTWFKDLKVTYSIAICTSILWVIYSLIVGAHVSIISNVIELFGGIFGLKRILAERKENKC